MKGIPSSGLVGRDNVEEAGNQDLDRGYVFAVSNQTALQSARQNQHVIGIDGKHGLQDEFCCPASFTIMNRENTQNIFLAIRSILENVPCGRADCQHPYRYFALPGNLGYRRVTGCSRVNEYKPLVMIDKFEASANACEELGLQYVLCWFHIVKALMEKLTQESVSLLNAYLIILAFKIVARSVCEEVSKERWIMFLEVCARFVYS
ncbi:unnamed protein product [Mytilus edulis]|uniref:Uncharacterized protein n=1 Tax=Mytilus edulis TaxID=6550 RepID=A0A8S3TGK1_MYTED|nr:unnamed protein product [Mytilus edulis]